MICGESIQASLIRQVWEVIEETQSIALLQWSDQDMVHQLTCRLQGQRSLNGQELKEVTRYLSDRTVLIRDVVADRRGIVY